MRFQFPATTHVAFAAGQQFEPAPVDGDEEQQIEGYEKGTGHQGDAQRRLVGQQRHGASSATPAAPAAPAGAAVVGSFTGRRRRRRGGNLFGRHYVGRPVQSCSDIFVGYLS